MSEDGNKDNQTFTKADDGALVVKDDKGTDVRYVPETDLLAVKGSKESAEQKAKEAEAKVADGETAKAELETTRQGKLQAEAKISSLEEQIAKGTGTAAELEQANKDLETAKTSGEELSNKLLELQRTLIVATYNIPIATIEKKTLAELEVFAEALEATTGTKLGNYAAGGGGGGGDLSGKTPMELARMAYEKK